jgi:hypothetical protein
MSTNKQSQYLLDIILPKDFRPTKNVPTDEEAKALYTLWKDAPNGTSAFALDNGNKKFLSGWKVKGLVSGIAEHIELTEKGRKLIVEMVTNEPNAFSKSSAVETNKIVKNSMKDKKEPEQKPFNLKKERQRHGNSDNK